MMFFLALRVMLEASNLSSWAETQQMLLPGVVSRVRVRKSSRFESESAKPLSEAVAMPSEERFLLRRDFC